MRRTVATCLSLVLILAVGPAALGQSDPAPEATRPAADGEPMAARVIRVTGNVSHLPPGAADAPEAWKPAGVGDSLPPGTKIRTRLRSSVVLQFGDDTVVGIDRVTLAAIEDFHRSGDTKRMKIGLGYGTVRAAVREATLRSDMTIESPTATLSKRGTIDFGMHYEAGTGQFTIFLNEEGLVEALKFLTGERRTVRPGEFVTAAMLRWVDTAQRIRFTSIQDRFGVTEGEFALEVRSGTGLGGVAPGSGAGTYGGVRPAGAGGTGGTDLSNYRPGPISPPTGALYRPEGNFGTGLVPPQ